MDLKQKTINGLFWSFVDNSASLGFNFIIGIILARILTPREFGLIGMITIFIVIAQAFIDSGFALALIRKQDCTQRDYSTIFYFNLGVGIVLFLTLYFLAGSISNFFNESELKPLLQVLGLIIIIGPLGTIQSTILTKKINFKLQTKITVIASVISGIIGIAMALKGFGVWSLVARTLSRTAIITILLWIWISWKPVLVFCKASFKELFSFSYKLILSRLLDVIFKNSYYLVIGKYFSASDLGYYTRADQFKNLTSTNLSWIIERVSYPVLSSIQDDSERLLRTYTKIIKITMFATFILMMGLASVAEHMIITLIGEKWLPSAIFLQLLCVEGMFYPMQALNLSILQVKGRSDLFLRLEIIKKTLMVPVIFLGIMFNIKVMLFGMIVLSIISLYISSYYSGKLIGYAFKDQFLDILPSFFIAIIIAGSSFMFGQIINSSSLVMLIGQSLFIAITTVVVGELLKLEEYLYIKKTLIKQLQKYRSSKN